MSRDKFYRMHRSQLKLIKDLLEDETKYLPAAKTEMLKVLSNILDNDEGLLPNVNKEYDLIQFLCERYKKIIPKEIVPERTPEDFSSLAHTAWMIKTIRFKEMDNGKANRWLGFVQANLYIHKLIDIDKERDLIRELKDKV